MFRKFTATITSFFIIGITSAQPPIPGVIYVDFTSSPATIYAGSAVTFTASVSGNSTPVQFHWNFGDATSAITPNADMRHIYNSPGVYTVSLRAFTGYGDSSDLLSRMIIVSATANNGVTANFSYPSPVYENTAVQFLDNSNTSSGTIVNYLWSINGSASSSVQNLLYIFPVYGIYEVKHVVSNNTGQQASISKLIHVLPSGTITQQVCSDENKFLFCYNQATNYQWQVSTDSGASFQNISDSDYYYSFAKTNGLLINYTPSEFYGYQYRCMADNVAGTVYKVEIRNQFTGIIDNTWENPANWSCGVLPNGNTDVVISSGTVVLNSNASCRSLTVNPAANFTVSPGFTLTITH